MSWHYAMYDVPSGYEGLLGNIIQHGDEVAPRGAHSLEIRDAVITLERTDNALPVYTGRKVNTGIAAAEAAQLISGLSSLPQLDAVSGGRFSRFSNGGRLLGAYGPRVRDQLKMVIDRLTKDPSTRQANAVIWRPDDLQNPTNDLPCTMYFNFSIRCNKLLMTAHMRSNDAWLGTTYDIFMFTQLQRAVANALNIEPGLYTHHVDSLHLYSHDIDAASKIEAAYDVQPFETDIDCHFEEPANRWSWITYTLENVVLGKKNDNTPFFYEVALPQTAHHTQVDWDTRYAT